MNRRRHKSKTERYELERSPLAQKPTQKQLAELVGFNKSALRKLAREKESFIIRREAESGKKLRQLAYPRGKLRGVHEAFKFHLGKIIQPEYLYSPRSRRGQRDNAALHVNGTQYLSLDIKQFYPSTTREHVFRWAVYNLGMAEDVARLFCDLSTVDGKVSFGSPLTPVLTTLIHREMFDAIHMECKRRGLKMSLWVDDIVISGLFVPGRIIEEVRSIISKYWLRSHKLEIRTCGRPVVITGIPIHNGRVLAPPTLNKRIREGYFTLRGSKSSDEIHASTDRLLGALGTYRYVVGAKTIAGQKASQRMAALRQRRANVLLAAITLPDTPIQASDASTGDDPF